MTRHLAMPFAAPAWGVAPAAFLLLAATAPAGPNLMAIGDYEDLPLRRAEGRESFTGKEIVYAFHEPGFDFGRIVVRSNQRFSQLKENLFVGFSGSGLIVDTRGPSGGNASDIDELEFWLRIHGRIRPGRSYEWDVLAAAGNDVIDGGVPAIIPTLWADGASIGVEVTIRTPEPSDEDKIQRNVLPHGIVTVPSFQRQTGGAWVVIRPRSFGNFFLLRRFSFREIETKESLAASAGEMPIPVRYIPIRDVVEDEIANTLQRGVDALKRARTADERWNVESLEESVRLTALAAAAIGEVDIADEAVPKALDWLAAQSAVDNEPWGSQTVAARLYALSRFGKLDKHRATIARDIQFLVNAQYKDNGGWSPVSPDVNAAATTVVQTDNDSSFTVMAALREARFAGQDMDARIWKDAGKYWSRAVRYDGGFGRVGERLGATSFISTLGYTALGATALIGTLDMAAQFKAANCQTYTGNREQLRQIAAALKWLDEHYADEYFESSAVEDPYLEPIALQRLGEVSGISVLRGRDHFTESARKLLAHFDESRGLFGIRGEKDQWTEQPSLLRTARAIAALGAGAAPTIVQRMIVGDDEETRGEIRSDAAHVVRYLSLKRGRPFHWRRAPQDRDVRFLAEVPILILTVLGRFDWAQEQWDKIREYCLAGGTVVVDIAKDQEDRRDEILSRLRSLFPEYTLRELPSDAPVFTLETKLDPPPPLLALGNGFREFLFLPKESWSCEWHLYSDRSRRTGFDFMNNLLSYVTDGSPPRSWLARSTYALASVPTHSMKAMHLQVGSDVPAYPNLLETMDRLLQANYRLRVERVTDPKDAQLLWMTVAGGQSISPAQWDALKTTLNEGRFVLVDVVSGSQEWNEAIRGQLRSLPELSLDPLRRSHSIFTGEIPGTQGFDCAQVAFRKALQTPWATSGRCDLSEIRWNNAPVGVFSAYDLSSGVVHHIFPNCRGVMPPHARELAMNLFLTAYQQSMLTSAASAAKEK